MKILDCKPLAATIHRELKEKLELILATDNKPPTLAIISIGRDGANLSYKKNATKKLEDLGLRVKDLNFSEDIEEKTFIEELKKISISDEIDGILLLRPLKKDFNEEKICALISPEKDVDCTNSINLGRIVNGIPLFIPCTVLSVIEILDFFDITLRGKEVAIIGRSAVVSRPLAELIIGLDATVTVCHSKTENLRGVLKRADIIITAMGRAKMIDETYISENTTIIDVGINFDKDNKLCGDVNIDRFKDLEVSITPVPGGVGSITSLLLAKQVIRAYELQKGYK